MKIETSPLENHQIKVIVEATPEEFEASRNKAVRQLTKKIKIPGFRPGKAPIAIALKHLDPRLVNEETLETFIDQYYEKILDESKIDPYGPGSLENIISLEPLTLEFVIPLKPKVELGDYHSVRVPFENPVTDETEVDSTLDRLRYQYGVAEPVERPIQVGDSVYVDIKGYVVEADGKTDELITNLSNFPIDVKDQSTIPFEFPFPGFSKHLIGLTIDNSIEINYTYPEDFTDEKIRGKTVQYDVTIKNIKQIHLPDLNDEFAQSLGEFSSLDDLRKSVRETLEQNNLDGYLTEYENQVLDEIIKISTIHYPPQMVEKEKEHILEDLEKTLKRSNMDLELYLKTRSITREDLDQELVNVAENRIKRSLVLLEIADRENIELDKEEVQKEVLQAYTGVMERVKKEKKSKELDQQIIPQLFQEITSEMLINKTLEKIRQIAKGEEENSPTQSEGAEAAQPEKTGDSKEQPADLSNVSEITPAEQPLDIPSDTKLENE
ncbi:MAG: trigger factor [Anaerolineales bacterium]